MKTQKIAAAIAVAGVGIGIATWLFMKKRKASHHNTRAYQPGKIFESHPGNGFPETTEAWHPAEQL